MPPSRLFTIALTDYDDPGQPAVRAFVNILTTRITSLTLTEITRLSDEKIGRIIETEFSRLSDDEICSLLDASLLEAEKSGFFDSVGVIILKALAAGVADSIKDLIKTYPIASIAFHIFGCCLYIQSGTSLSHINYYLYSSSNFIMLLLLIIISFLSLGILCFLIYSKIKEVIIIVIIILVLGCFSLANCVFFFIISLFWS